MYSASTNEILQSCIIFILDLRRILEHSCLRWKNSAMARRWTRTGGVHKRKARGSEEPEVSRASEITMRVWQNKERTADAGWVPAPLNLRYEYSGSSDLGEERVTKHLVLKTRKSGVTLSDLFDKSYQAVHKYSQEEQTVSVVLACGKIWWTRSNKGKNIDYLDWQREVSKENTLEVFEIHGFSETTKENLTLWSLVP